MDKPMSQIGRYAIKGELHRGGPLHFIDAWSNLAAAIDSAEAVYGYDRVVVLDTHNQNKEVWDSLDAVKR